MSKSIPSQKYLLEKVLPNLNIILLGIIVFIPWVAFLLEFNLVGIVLLILLFILFKTIDNITKERLYMMYTDRETRWRFLTEDRITTIRWWVWMSMFIFLCLTYYISQKSFNGFFSSIQEQSYMVQYYRLFALFLFGWAISMVTLTDDILFNITLFLNTILKKK